MDPRRVDLINDQTQDMVGRVVTGVVQATFDGGYLITVKIGNSSIPLTGAVIKPGHAAPITPENDTAPPLPKTNYGFSSSVPQADSRGTVVPVVLQPKHLSNNIPNTISRNQPAPHLRASLSKRVHSVRPLAVYQPNGSISQPFYFQTSSQFGNMNEPLFVEPLQTRHPVQHFQPPPVFGGVSHGGTGRMTDLLNAVQRGADQVAQYERYRKGHQAGN